MHFSVNFVEMVLEVAALFRFYSTSIRSPQTKYIVMTSTKDCGRQNLSRVKLSHDTPSSSQTRRHSIR